MLNLDGMPNNPENNESNSQSRSESEISDSGPESKSDSLRSASEPNSVSSSRSDSPVSMDEKVRKGIKHLLNEIHTTELSYIFTITALTRAYRKYMTKKLDNFVEKNNPANRETFVTLEKIIPLLEKIIAVHGDLVKSMQQNANTGNIEFDWMDEKKFETLITDYIKYFIEYDSFSKVELQHVKNLMAEVNTNLIINKLPNIQGLNDILITPIQRLTRYKLLFDGIAKELVKSESSSDGFNKKHRFITNLAALCDISSTAALSHTLRNPELINNLLSSKEDSQIKKTIVDLIMILVDNKTFSNKVISPQQEEEILMYIGKIINFIGPEKFSVFGNGGLDRLIGTIKMQSKNFNSKFAQAILHTVNGFARQQTAAKAKMNASADDADGGPSASTPNEGNPPSDGNAEEVKALALPMNAEDQGTEMQQLLLTLELMRKQEAHRLEENARQAAEIQELKAALNAALNNLQIQAESENLLREELGKKEQALNAAQAKNMDLVNGSSDALTKRLALTDELALAYNNMEKMQQELSSAHTVNTLLRNENARVYLPRGIAVAPAGNGQPGDGGPAQRRAPPAP